MQFFVPEALKYSPESHHRLWLLYQSLSEKDRGLTLERLTQRDPLGYVHFQSSLPSERHRSPQGVVVYDFRVEGTTRRPFQEETLSGNERHFVIAADAIDLRHFLAQHYHDSERRFPIG